MSPREKPSDSADDTFEEQNTSRGGRKDGTTPDYEKAMTPMNDQNDYDIDRTKMR